MAKVRIPAKVATLQRATSREEWLANRRSGIGASEAAALFRDPDTGKSASPWLTPLKLYAQKVGEADEDPEQTEAQEIGIVMEPAVAELARRRLGIEIDTPPEHALYRSVDLPVMTATPDRFTIERDVVGVLELKTSDHWFAHAWKDDSDAPAVPLYYQIQVQQQLAVLGLVRGRVAALVGRKFMTFDVDRNDAFATRLMEEIAAFWKRVQERRPPEPEAGDLDSVKRLFPRAREGTAIRLTDAEANDLREWVAQDAIIKAAEERVDLAKARIALAIGDFDDGLMPDGAKVTHRNRTAETRPAPAVLDALDLLRSRVAQGVPVTPEEAARLVELLAPMGETKVRTGRVLLRPRTKKGA